MVIARKDHLSGQKQKKEDRKKRKIRAKTTIYVLGDTVKLSLFHQSERGGREKEMVICGQQERGGGKEMAASVRPEGTEAVEAQTLMRI